MGLMIVCLWVAAALRFPGLTTAPPPIHYDEAANGIIVQEIAFQGYRPVFIPSYTGKDVLFFYLAGGMARLAGGSVFTLRYTAALVGVLTVAATYWLTRELTRRREVALFAAALLAVTFWHILFSRLGFRVITEPLLQALTAAALWRGFRREQFRWLTLGGICLGLTAYTYLSARLFPLPLGLALLPFLLNRHRWRDRLEQFGYTIALAFLTLIPLLLYFYRNPDAFWVRILQVAPASEQQLTVGQAYLKALGMLFIQGDPYWRYNQPGQPIFNWVWGGFLLAGTVYVLLRLAQDKLDWQRGAWLLLLFAPLLMLLPTALATNEIVPSNIRAMGILPFVMLLPALGVDWLLRDMVQQRWPARFAAATVSIFLLILLIQGGLSANLYFRHWATRVDLFYESDGDIAAAAAWIDEYDTTDLTVYLAAVHYRHPTAAYLSQKYEQIQWLPNSEAIVWPQDGPALTIYPRNSAAPPWLTPLLPQATPISGPAGPLGEPLFMAYRWDAPPVIETLTPAAANFGNLIQLHGYRVEPATIGQVVELTLLWQILNPPQAPYLPFVHLEDQWGHRWSQIESFAYPSEQWRPGDWVLHYVTLPLADGTPPGEYRLQIGFFHSDNGERLAHLDSLGRFAGTSTTLEAIPLLPGEPPRIIPVAPIARSDEILSQLRFLGHEPFATAIESGAPLTVSLWWYASAPLPPLTLRFELFRPDGFGRILRHSQPVHGSLPFNQWPAPLFLKDHQTVFIPPDLPGGSYRLTLRLLGSGDESLYAAELGVLAVTATERLFTLPPIPFPVRAAFGDEITLVGYDWRQEGEQLYLTLVWQADRVAAADYTVFVHLLNPDGVCCPWQADRTPQGNYPTSRWLAGEVIVDEYIIPLADLPGGRYPIEIGLYLPQTGRRLTVTLPNGTVQDALHLQTIDR